MESLDIATVCGQTFLFLGSERTSTIFVFDITVSIPANVKRLNIARVHP